jgi:hypothetical protein
MTVHLLLAAFLLLQSQPPEFTGTWKMVADRSGSAVQSAPIREMTFVIEQVPESIRLDMVVPGRDTVSTTYLLVPPPRQQPAEPLSAGQQRAYWDGNRLIVERGGTIQGQTVSSKQTLSLSPDRSELTIERLVIVQHGYTLKGTQNYATVRDVFVRAPQ